MSEEERNGLMKQRRKAREKIEHLQNELDNANSKVSELSNRILKAIDVLLDTTLDYTDGDFESMRFQNDIVKILKGVDR